MINLDFTIDMSRRRTPSREPHSAAWLARLADTDGAAPLTEPAARALAADPDLLIADEPTSALDADARADFLHLLMTECKVAGSAIIFVSHDRSLARQFDREVNLLELNQLTPGRTA